MEDRKYKQLDTFRCWGFICVLFLHWEWSGRDIAEAMGIGARALDLFFVISGFLISLILLRSKNKENSIRASMYKFYVRRFLRIFPIYYLFLLIVWCFNHQKVADSILWNITYLSNFYSIKTQQFGGVGHLWSLAVEEQFYLVWPFLLLVLGVRYLPYAMIGCVLLSLGAKVYWHIHGYTFWTSYMHPLGSLDVMAWGGLLAYLYYYHLEKLRSWLFNPYLTAIVVAQAFTVLAFKYVHGYEFIYNIGVRTFWGIFCLWLTGRAVFGFTGITGRILSYPPFVYIGKISYSMYLFHTLVPGMLLGMKYPQSPDLRFLICFAVIVGIGTLSWYLIESPILRLKQKYE